VKSVSFTFDLWSSRGQHSYMSLTCHYLTKQFQLKNKTLGCMYFPGEHSGQAIFSEIKQAVFQWGLG